MTKHVSDSGICVSLPVPKSMISELGDLMDDFYPGRRINEVSTTMLALLLLSRGENVEWMRGMLDEKFLPNFEFASQAHTFEVPGNTTANLLKILWAAQNTRGCWSHRFVRRVRRSFYEGTAIEFSFADSLDASKFFFSFTDAKPLGDSLYKDSQNT